MGSKRAKRRRTDADPKILIRQENLLKLGDHDGGHEDLLAHYDEQGYDFSQQEEYGKRVDHGQGEMYEDCRHHQRKRPRRVIKPLVDLSEYEKFCVDPACTPVWFHLPCEVLDAKRQDAVAMEESLHLFVVAEVSQTAALANVDSQSQGKAGYGCKNKKPRCDYGLEPTSPERKLLDCKLKIMATRLNYGVDVWSLAAQLVNPYEVLPSVAVRVLNRAFFKMWELMQMFPGLVPPVVATKKKLLSAHLCEGPGGFVQALRMFRSPNANSEKYSRTGTSSFVVDSSSGEKDSWFAITLASPGSENGTTKMQTSKIQEFTSNAVEGHVHYGADQSGDITNPNNISSFVQFVLKKTGGEKMRLITGDGAFDISDDFSSQEQSHVHLFFCEILLAVRLQCPGGALVLKVFDCFTETMTTLLCILTSLYTTVDIVRLRTSRVCNSERFVVAQGFRFLPRSFEDKLMSISTAWYKSAKDGFSATAKLSKPYPLFLEALNQGNAAVANDQSMSILQAVAVAEDLGERLSFTNTSQHKGILSILRRKMKTIELLRTNALTLCETLNIPLANTT